MDRREGGDHSTWMLSALLLQLDFKKCAGAQEIANCIYVMSPPSLTQGHSDKKKRNLKGDWKAFWKFIHVATAFRLPPHSTKLLCVLLFSGYYRAIFWEPIHNKEFFVCESRALTDAMGLSPPQGPFVLCQKNCSIHYPHRCLARRQKESVKTTRSWVLHQPRLSLSTQEMMSL